MSSSGPDWEEKGCIKMSSCRSRSLRPRDRRLSRAESISPNTSFCERKRRNRCGHWRTRLEPAAGRGGQPQYARASRIVSPRALSPTPRPARAACRLVPCRRSPPSAMRHSVSFSRWMGSTPGKPCAKLIVGRFGARRAIAVDEAGPPPRASEQRAGVGCNPWATTLGSESRGPRGPRRRSSAGGDRVNSIDSRARSRIQPSAFDLGLIGVETHKIEVAFTPVFLLIDQIIEEDVQPANPREIAPTSRSGAIERGPLPCGLAYQRENGERRT